MNLSFLTAAAGVIALSFTGVLVLTPVVRAVARRGGVIAAPRSDRWHARPTAKAGGVAIFLAMLISLPLVQLGRPSLILVAPSIGLFVLGLIDDLRPIAPFHKLLGQTIAAAAVVYYGDPISITAWNSVNVLVTMLWIVGVTNAVNLLDNMDGLAAGVTAIAALFLAAVMREAGQRTDALLMVALAGALIGFLIYNRQPASIFMGDCGALFVGFLVACGALTAAKTSVLSRGMTVSVSVAALVLAVAIFDTALVIVLRTRAGYPVSQGGRDHASHRLVALGLSESRAVWLLWSVAIVGGVVGMLVEHASPLVAVLVVISFGGGLLAGGFRLASAHVYPERSLLESYNPAREECTFIPNAQQPATAIVTGGVSNGRA